ncbi:MAG: serine/threonine-protein kinase [Cyanobacteria bacterium J06576_12]
MTSSQSTTSGHPQPNPTAQKAKPLFKNQFKILKRLGRGGFSTTYLAEDISTSPASTPCVIKQLRYKSKGAKANKALQAEHNCRRFQKEARIMARLGQHNQIPYLLEHFIEDGQFYLVQEHIPGLTLQQQVSKHGIQTEAQVKTFLHDIIPIVRYMHRHNLLHLDIKPANIIRRSTDEKLVLIDFGAVRRYTPESTKAQQSSGTTGFAPSEQFAGLPTPASDLYSIGVTCLYLLTGCPPLDFATSTQGQNLRWQESIQVSPHLTEILHKLLATQAEHRYQSIDELERVLNLESHYSELKTCLTKEPFSGENFKAPAACRLDEYLLADSSELPGQSKASHQARSIRRWQQRRRRFKTFTPK